MTEPYPFMFTNIQCFSSTARNVVHIESGLISISECIRKWNGRDLCIVEEEGSRSQETIEETESSSGENYFEEVGIVKSENIFRINRAGRSIRKLNFGLP